MWNPINEKQFTTRFDARGTGTNNWQVYNVPKGATALYIIAVGGAGAGGSGFGAAAGAARGGGGGGGSGASAKLWIPTNVLPGMFYIQCGLGGQTSNANGAATQISVDRGTAAASRILTLNGGTGGGNGTGAAAGGAGGAAGISNATAALYQNWGAPVWVVGQAGAAGGAQTGAVGASVTFGAVGMPISGGAGGAGCTAAEFAGGAITGAGLIATISGGAAGANPGQAGKRILTPLTYTGGSGAGSSNTVAGAAGGDGAPGCGGGGGGAGVTTGGAGGKGGNGFVIITAIF